jgi:diguanylate cyclase (GGDEF)-like protein
MGFTLHRGFESRPLRFSPLKARRKTADHVSVEEARSHVCCSMTSVLVRLVRAAGGDDAVAAVLSRAGWTRGAHFLESTENWVSLDGAIALLEAAVAVTGDPELARRTGAEAVRQHAGSPAATVLRSLGSPEAIYGAIVATASKFTTVTRMETVESGPGRALVRSQARPGFVRHALLCEWAQGLLSTPPMLFGLPPARVVETACAARGAHWCTYEISWDAERAEAAKDPAQQVTALEAQLVAMSKRLEQVYATATDLVSPDDLETILARIVDRAAGEVRATGYVLAVTPEGGDQPQIFSRGLSERDAQSLARSGSLDGHTALVADVASAARDYGRLIVVSASGSEFFDQELALLTLYAKHAAAVLDMATALQTAARRHDQVSGLLAFAHALSHAGTSAEVAERLAMAVPTVIDCDGVGVWLWDEDAGDLCLGARDHGDGRDALLAGVHIAPADTPALRAMIDVPAPAYFEADTDDAFLAAIMAGLEVAAMTIVPIMARDEFLGVLTVTARARPERLRPTAELVEHLTGVAALAATALRNGRLVDTLEHRARHDSLTDLLNRAGFARRMTKLLESAGERAGLLFIDLDSFKQVNDAHGHDAGDELLRQAARRLTALFRRGDSVARLGGDEFAVVLDDVGDPAEVSAAAERTRAAFAEPFRVAGVSVRVGASVGEAVWPDGGATVEALVQCADAAMYRNKAASRGG